jgi:hypothetical protein
VAPHPTSQGPLARLRSRLAGLLFSAAVRLGEAGQPPDDLARLFARHLPRLTAGPHAGRYFQLWEAHGFHLTPVHYYQPIPDTRTLDPALWTRESTLCGLEMNEAGQLELLQTVFPRYRTEYEQLPAGPAGEAHSYYFNNSSFGGTDALVLYCLVRHLRPQLIVEVGAGFSTRLLAQAAAPNGPTRLVSIEPNPDAVVAGGFPGLTKLLDQPVEQVDPAVFGELQAGDVLFIDSSHVVRADGDVTHLFLEVLPRLNPGVVVHVHDIFLPGQYPRKWMLEWHLFWTEQYLLHAFLLFNHEFEVLFANAFMGARHGEVMRAVFPTSPWWGGGSFWMRRRSI